MKQPTIAQRNSFTVLSLGFVLAALLFITAIIGFWYIADTMIYEQKGRLDQAMIRYMHGLETPGRTRLALFITFFGSVYFQLPFYLLLIGYFLYKRRHYRALEVSTIAGISLLLGMVLKGIFRRQRPLLEHWDTVTGYSFPSGHSLAAFTLCGMLVYLLWLSNYPVVTKWLVTVALVVAACAIGLSRIYLHVHYASDVLGGLLLTVAWLTVSLSFFRFLEKRRNNRMVEKG
jgi:undecaprenyl-diphosphatase